MSFADSRPKQPSPEVALAKSAGARDRAPRRRTRRPAWSFEFLGEGDAHHGCSFMGIRIVGPALPCGRRKRPPPPTPLPMPRHATSGDDSGRLSGEIDLEVWLVVGCLVAFPS